MKAYKKIFAPALALALLAGCGRGLPPSLEREISLEADRVQNAERQVQRSETALLSDINHAPDLFKGVAEVDSWKAGIRGAKADLQAAQNDGKELAALLERNRPEQWRVSQLLSDEKRARESALHKTQSVDQAVAKWVDYERDPAAFAAKVNREREQLRAFDSGPVSQTVQKAEKDWPAKKTVLQGRLTSLLDSAKTAEDATQTSPAALIEEDQRLSQQETRLDAQAHELTDECGQLYDSWDKILTDLDRSQSDDQTLYRERLKTVRTHLIDVPLKKSETHSDEHWANVSEASFRSVENDIGMAIAHKDAGLFDSEATDTPQPPGFSYVASPAAGSNQYGYWTHSGGQSFWTFLPEYLILRELLWNHDYHPVMAGEYNAYRMAQSRGTSYYGRETPTAPPKYGTHGTFTQTHYADSRYVQSGGFQRSAYASNSRGNAGDGLLNRFRPEPASPSSVGEAPGGRRFGRQPGAESPGQRFGRVPSSRPSGRSFGRRR